MKRFNLVICSFIGAIGGRVIYTKDWFAFSLTLSLLILFLIYDFINSEAR